VIKKIILILLVVLISFGSIIFFYYKDKVFSEEILQLEILGPSDVKMGEEIEYTVKYKNNGNFILENAKIIFELPDNSLTEDSQTRFKKDLKDINPGTEDFIKFKGRLLGKEGDLKVVKAIISYSPYDLSVKYESEANFTSKIDSVNLSLDFDLPAIMERGKELSYSLIYNSKIDYPLENLSIKIDSPLGFSFKSSDPPSFDNLEWKLKTLSNNQGGKINIKGIISTESESPLVFRAILGMWQDGDFILIKEKSFSLQLTEPPIDENKIENDSILNGQTDFQG